MIAAMAVVCAPTFHVRTLDTEGLFASARLSAIRFGFEERDQVPPWLVHTLRHFGGVALGAYASERLVGYSYGVPGFDGREPFLLGCGLAVDPEFESLGVAERLKMTQRERAREAGYATVRWTTTSLASRSLYVYLSKLGARLVRYHEGFYRDTQDNAFPDEVELVWAVDGEPSDAQAADCRLVEIPWDRHALEHDRQLARGWVAWVRFAMQRLLDGGYHGTRVVLDRQQRRSFVQFEHPAGGR